MLRCTRKLATPAGDIVIRLKQPVHDEPRFRNRAGDAVSGSLITHRQDQISDGRIDWRGPLGVYIAMPIERDVPSAARRHSADFIRAGNRAIETMAKIQKRSKIDPDPRDSLRRCSGRRGNSKLPSSSPCVSYCRLLAFPSPPRGRRFLQDATMMINELRSNLLELTGRGSSRAWAVI